MNKQKLRVLGISVTLLEVIRLSAEEDLGIEIEYEILDGAQCQQKAVLHPDKFDIYDQWFNSVDLLSTAGAIQPIETSRITLWDQVSDLTKKGRINPTDKLGQGANPVEVQFVQADGNPGPNPTRQITMLPTAYNVDAFVYRPTVGKHYGSQTPESWAWLFDDEWHGKCGLQREPAIGVADVALGAQAAGLMQFDDIGNMSIGEIDDLVALLIERKKSGHFRHFWTTPSESVKMMDRKNAVIACMWAPAIHSLQAAGQNIKCASPVEGYRGWHSGLSLSSRLEGERLDAAYKYLNWWLSGKAGATIARQGYYMSVPETTREHLSEDEWNYWYGGLPAQNDILGLDGRTIATKGGTRDGGSYSDRISNIALWNTLMDEHNYLVRRWNEFLTA